MANGASRKQGRETQSISSAHATAAEKSFFYYLCLATGMIIVILK
jgi:hypothetical protein